MKPGTHDDHEVQMCKACFITLLDRVLPWYCKNHCGANYSESTILGDVNET